MLRDIPRIYLIFFGFGMTLMLTMVLYTNAFMRGGDTLALNDIALTSAVSEIDQMSRIKEGTLVLEDTFEKKAWVQLSEKYPEGSIVRFDYLFNQNNAKASSKEYSIGGSASQTPQISSAVFRDKQVKAIRVLVRDSSDHATAKGQGWTYTSTIKLDVGKD